MTYESTLTTAQNLIARWSGRDADGLRELLTEDATLVIPLSADGSPEPFYTFTGADQVLGYMRGALANLPQIRFVNQEWSVSSDGRYVHLHADGDMVAKTGAKYQNKYVYRLTFRDDRIAAIDEYANPIAWTNLGL